MYQTKVPPYEHQAEALVRLANKPAFALTMAMRTGKTKVLLDDFGRRELIGQVKDLLVIAPAGVYRTWVTAMEEHLSDDLRSRVLVSVWSSSASGVKVAKERTEFLNSTDRPRVLLMNVEALSGVERAQYFCLKFLRDPNKAMIAVDESTIIKKHNTKRTKFINDKLAPRALLRRILSGLPSPRSPLDLYSQYEFLDPNIIGLPSFTTFRARYAIVEKIDFGGRWPAPVVKGYQNLDDLKARIEPYTYRVEFRPKIPSTYTIREVSLTEEQKRAYKEIKQFATTKLDDGSHVTATIVITQLMRLHQVLCGHVGDEQGNVREVPEKRTDELLELLEDYNGKAIIWCSYDFSVRKVARALALEYDPNCIVYDQWGGTKKVEPTFPNPYVARFWGGNDTTREEEEKEFKQSDKCRFMVATPSAGGRGRTWANADLVVYYSSTDNLEHRDQSEQRAQGLEKERQVDYIDLIAPGTVEPQILKALRNKINLSDLITGDNWREWVV